MARTLQISSNELLKVELGLFALHRCFYHSGVHVPGVRNPIFQLYCTYTQSSFVA